MFPASKEFKNGFRAIRYFLQPFSRELVILIVLGVLSAIANGSVPYITGRFFDELINVAGNRAEIGFGALPLWGFLLLIWAIIQLTANVVDWINDRVGRTVNSKLHFNIQVDGFIHLFKLPLLYHKNHHIHGEMQKINNAGWRVGSIVRNVVRIGPEFLSLIIGIILAASINVSLAGILIIGVLLYSLLLVRILKPAAENDSLAHRSWNEKWDEAASAVTQIESVKQAAAEEYESEKTRVGLAVVTYALWQKLETIWSNVSFFQRVIVLGTQLTVFMLSVRLVADGSLTIGELLALNGYAAMFFGPFVSLGYTWQTIQN
ncbi:MAG: ABC transporter ATP-binding protein, partial [Patescibacteria group bacterium]